MHNHMFMINSIIINSSYAKYFRLPVCIIKSSYIAYIMLNETHVKLYGETQGA